MSMVDDMTAPMTRKTYEKLVDDLLRTPFPWARGAFFDPAPGHLESVAALLADCERIADRTHLEKHLTFLFIARDEDEDLCVRLECAELSEAQHEALRLLARRAQARARKLCVVCGQQVRRGHRHCEAHEGQDSGLMSEAGSGAQADTLAQALKGLKSAHGLTKQPSEVSDAPAAELAHTKAGVTAGSPRPTVQLFDARAVTVLKESMAGQESDARLRIRTMCERLAKSGPDRPLAVLPNDWRDRIERLAGEFPNFAAYFEFLLGHCALSAMGDGRLSHPPALFDGPPGIGKTELVNSLSEIFDTDCLQLDMAVAQTSSPLTGSETHWGNSRQGRFFDTLVFGRTANPIVMVDEIDKVRGHDGYDPAGGLLTLLEPRTAACFTDLSVPQVPLDARHVVWFAVSNDYTRISAPLLSRFERFEIPAPDRAQTAHIACGIYRRIVQGRPWGMQFEQELDAEAASALAGMSPRQIRIALETAFGRAALAGRNHLATDDLRTGRQAGRERAIGFLQFNH